MTAPPTTHENISPSLNHLQRGATYRVTTPNSSNAGEYLGIESSHGDRAILLRNATGTASIPLDQVTSIRNTGERSPLATAAPLGSLQG
jgi:hypothetical protein